MNAIDIARRLSEMGAVADACQAYALVIHENSGKDPAVEMEAALYLLKFGGNYQMAYTCFQQLYNRGFYQAECLEIMTAAFYEPNVKLLKKRYELNCKQLSKYPYLFRKDFLPFANLPIKFFPFDDKGYLPFYSDQTQFGDYVNFKEPVISRNFFKDLEKPILANDVYSQYELEYLTDNVRKSEFIGRENHIYLHYTDWAAFCSYLVCLDMRPLLKERKIVFLIEDQVSQYPIDFKARFHIDYSKYPVKPVGIQEINRLIWHVQFACGNGGDFFNEVFDSHPNLLLQFSTMYDSIADGVIPEIRREIVNAESLQAAVTHYKNWPAHISQELYTMQNPTDKDILVAWFLSKKICTQCLDPNSRIVPAIFYQPHFSNINYTFEPGPYGSIMLKGLQLEKIHKSRMFDFKYIKSFIPVRRFTTSYGSTVRSMYGTAKRQEKEDPHAKMTLVVPDAITQRVCNRSFMRDVDDRLYYDSVVVRFEDGKLNPTATFSALAAFLDLPYTESMTYCSENGIHDVQSWAGNVIGFDTAPVYRTYDDWTNDSERACLEFLLRDAYEYYGYDFHYYNGQPMDEEQYRKLLDEHTRLDAMIYETWARYYQPKIMNGGWEALTEAEQEQLKKKLDSHLEKYQKSRIEIGRIMMGTPRFVNEREQPLHMIPLLKLDPALLDHPLYH